MSQSNRLSVVALILSTIGCGPQRLSDEPESTPAKKTAPAVEASAQPAEKPSSPAKENSVIADALTNIGAADSAMPVKQGLEMPTVGSLLQGDTSDPLLTTPLQIETNPPLEPVGGVPIYPQPGIIPGVIR